MGDFVKKSTDLDFALPAIATATAFALGGPVAALAVGGTALSVGAQRQAAGAREVELELAQRRETTASRDREIQRRRRLVAILGSQSANAAASGLAMSGSVANISMTDAQRAAEDSFVDDFNTRTRIDALKRNRASVSRLSTVRSATTILNAGERILARGGP